MSEEKVPASKEEHVHRYKRVDAGVNRKYLVYSCADPNCPKGTHYLTPKIVVNRKTICWGCEKATPMTKEMASMANPKCVLCRNSKNVNDVLDLVQGILEGKKV